MNIADVTFYVLSFFILVAGVCVVLSKSPLMSALFLACAMVGLAFVFFLLEAPSLSMEVPGI